MGWTPTLTVLFFLIQIGLTLAASIPLPQPRPLRLSLAFWVFLWLAPLSQPFPIRETAWLVTILLVLAAPYSSYLPTRASRGLPIYLIFCLGIATLVLTISSGPSISALIMTGLLAALTAHLASARRMRF